MCRAVLAIGCLWLSIFFPCIPTTGSYAYGFDCMLGGEVTARLLSLQISRRSLCFEVSGACPNPGNFTNIPSKSIRTAAIIYSLVDTILTIRSILKSAVYIKPYKCGMYCGACIRLWLLWDVTGNC